jgi:hypothetical protein
MAAKKSFCLGDWVRILTPPAGGMVGRITSKGPRRASGKVLPGLGYDVFLSTPPASMTVRLGADEIEKR